MNAARGVGTVAAYIPTIGGGRMLNSLRVVQVLVALAAAGSLVACGKTGQPAATPAPNASPVKLTAGIQDIMRDMIDPAADFLWESVSTTETAEGVEEKLPRTDEEWAEVRKHALILAES